MLSRIVRTPLRYALSATPQYQFSTLPQVRTQTKVQLERVVVTENDIFIEDISHRAINFVEQFNGKTIVLLAEPHQSRAFNAHRFSTALFTLGYFYGILSNFNYILTLGCFAGAAFCHFRFADFHSLQKKSTIMSIEVDQAQRLHLSVRNKDNVEKVIVEKKNFVYNVLNDSIWGANVIWCKANGEDLWIERTNLQINSQQFHHLL